MTTAPFTTPSAPPFDSQTDHILPLPHPLLPHPLPPLPTLAADVNSSYNQSSLSVLQWQGMCRDAMCGEIQTFATSNGVQWGGAAHATASAAAGGVGGAGATGGGVGGGGKEGRRQEGGRGGVDAAPAAADGNGGSGNGVGVGVNNNNGKAGPSGSRGGGDDYARRMAAFR